LILGIAFWGRTSGDDIEDMNSYSQELSTIEIANTVPEFSELKCYKARVSEVKCLDMQKIIAMRDAMSNDAVFKYYNNHFMNSKIEVNIIYPPMDNPNDANITIYDADINAKTSSVQIELPVNIKDNINGITRYGLLIVRGYYANG